MFKVYLDNNIIQGLCFFALSFADKSKDGSEKASMLRNLESSMIANLVGKQDGMNRNELCCKHASQQNIGILRIGVKCERGRKRKVKNEVESE